MTEDEKKIKAFSDYVQEVFTPAAAALDGAFVAMFVVGHSGDLTICQLKTNTEHPQALLEHCRSMIDTMLDDSVPTVDLRDVSRTEH